MMYTFGDVRTPLPSSAQLMEQIVKKQLVDIIIQAANIAISIRGARSISPEDVLFLVRKDPVKLSRLKEYMSWKDVRKNARTGEESSNVALENVPDEDIISFAQSVDVAESGQQKSNKHAKKKVTRLPWDALAALVTEATNGEVDLTTNDPLDPEAEQDTIQRLQFADRVTKDMSRLEYMEYAECRQASFTYKKSKKFRDWLNPAQYIDLRLNDDVVEILGFLAWELVRKITETALKMKKDPEIVSSDEKVEKACDLFNAPSEKTALSPEHIQYSVNILNRLNQNRLSSLRINPLKGLKFRLY